MTPSTEKKACKDCKKYYPADLENLYASKCAKDGLAPYCITCHRARNKARHREVRALRAEQRMARAA